MRNKNTQCSDTNEVQSFGKEVKEFRSKSANAL